MNFLTRFTRLPDTVKASKASNYGMYKARVVHGMKSTGKTHPVRRTQVVDQLF